MEINKKNLLLITPKLPKKRLLFILSLIFPIKTSSRMQQLVFLRRSLTACQLESGNEKEVNKYLTYLLRHKSGPFLSDIKDWILYTLILCKEKEVKLDNNIDINDYLKKPWSYYSTWIHDMYINKNIIDITDLKTKHSSFSKGNQAFKLVIGRVKKKQIDLAYNSMERAEKKWPYFFEFYALKKYLYFLFKCDQIMDMIHRIKLMPFKEKRFKYYQLCHKFIKNLNQFEVYLIKSTFLKESEKHALLDLKRSLLTEYNQYLQKDIPYFHEDENDMKYLNTFSNDLGLSIDQHPVLEPGKSNSMIDPN